MTRGLSSPATSEGCVTGLKVYPIKGCGPLVVRRWPMDPVTHALFLDRRWCVVASGSSGSTSSSRANTRPLSTKRAPQLAQVQISLWRSRNRRAALVVTARGSSAAPLILPLSARDVEILWHSGAEVEKESEDESVAASQDIWEQGCHDERAAIWFEALLNEAPLRLHEERAVADKGQSSHFANIPCTLLLISTASLKEVGRRCGLAMPAHRFRANLEVSLDVAFEEESWPVGQLLVVGDTTVFEAAGRCVRCQAVDIDPEQPQAAGPSLLAALASARPELGGDGASRQPPSLGVLLRAVSSLADKAAEAAAARARVEGATDAWLMIEVG